MTLSLAILRRRAGQGYALYSSRDPALHDADRRARVSGLLESSTACGSGHLRARLRQKRSVLGAL